MNAWPHQSDVDKFYGNPRGMDGEASASWEANNIVRVMPPWPLVTSWDHAPITKGAKMHRKCSESLERVFDRIWLAAEKQPAKIQEWGMHLYGGAYNFRLMRGGTRLSMHSWGCAIDFDTARNAFGDTTPNFALIPAVLDAFHAENWVWGGSWKKPDGMHFQAAIV